MRKRKVTDEQVLNAYEKAGNVWLAGKELGVCGQSIWERLKRLNVDLSTRHWTEDELSQLKGFYNVSATSPIDLKGFAKNMDRSPQNVSRKARELGLLTSYNRKCTQVQCDAMGARTKAWIKKNGHPRGFREMRFCPECNKFFEVPAAVVQKCCSQHCAYVRRFKGVNMFSRSVKGKRSDLNNQFFRSNYEANYARYLNFLIKHGEPILKWEFEPDTFEFKKIKKGVRFYTPDFKIYFANDVIEYHEVKGWDYPKGITQRKRFAKYYPQFKLLVIDDDFFKDCKRKGMDKLIPGWE